MKRYLYASVLAALAFVAIATTRCAAIAPGADPVIVNAERSEKIAFDTINAFVNLEYQNRADLQKALGVGVTAAADEMRSKAPALFKSWDAALDAYRLQKTVANSTALDNAAAALSGFVATAGQYIAQWKAAGHAALDLRKRFLPQPTFALAFAFSG